MGTSASSKGPGPNVPFDPPWLDVINPPPNVTIVPLLPDVVNPHTPVSTTPLEPQPIDTEGPAVPSPAEPRQCPPEPASIAPPRRFSSAKRLLTDFVKTGRRDSFEKAAGHYSRTGMGGTRNLAHRMRTATTTGANAISLLRSARDGNDPSVNDWVTSLTSRNASVHEIAHSIIQRIVPLGGSQDELACQDSMAQALQDLIAENENVDLLHLSDSDIWRLIESFL